MLLHGKNSWIREALKVALHSTFSFPDSLQIFTDRLNPYPVVAGVSSQPKAALNPP